MLTFALTSCLLCVCNVTLIYFGSRCVAAAEDNECFSFSSTLVCVVCLALVVENTFTAHEEPVTRLRQRRRELLVGVAAAVAANVCVCMCVSVCEWKRDRASFSVSHALSPQLGAVPRTSVASFVSATRSQDSHETYNSYAAAAAARQYAAR